NQARAVFAADSKRIRTQSQGAMRYDCLSLGWLGRVDYLRRGCATCQAIQSHLARISETDF
ncbi:MAG: hypothetical protein Q9192_003610, partial [Flavoplaca navasiana]